MHYGSSGSDGYRTTLTLLSLVILLVMISEAMLAAALPEIDHEFHPPGVFSTWILPMVLLIGASAAPLIGTIGDRFGRKRLLVFCMVLYCSGVICGGFSPDIWALLFFRALQGAGLAGFPLAYAIMVERFPADKADIGVGVMSAMYGGGTFFGVILGSFLTQFLSWRYTYYVLIPLSLSLLILLIRFIPEGVVRDRRIRNIDWKGFTCILVSLLSFLLVLSSGDMYGWVSPVTILACILSGGFFLVFLQVERNAVYPMLDTGMARDHCVLLILSIGFLTILVFFMMMQGIPFLIQAPSGLDLPVGYVGIILIPGALCDLIAGTLTGRLVMRSGFRLSCIIGSVLLLVAAVLCLVLPLGEISLAFIWMVFSGGMSVTATAALFSMMLLVPSDRTAGATGLAQSVQTIGGMIGPVLTGIIFASHQVSVLKSEAMWRFPDETGFSLLYYAILVITMIILLLSLALPRVQKNPSSSPGYKY